jgi:hypothetical protein
MPPDTPMPGMPQESNAQPDQTSPAPMLPHSLALAKLRADVDSLIWQHHAEAGTQSLPQLADPEFEQRFAAFKRRLFGYRDAHRREQLQARAIAPPRAQDQPGGDALPRFGGVPGVTVDVPGRTSFDYAARPDSQSFESVPTNRLAPPGPTISSPQEVQGGHTDYRASGQWQWSGGLPPRPLTLASTQAAGS